MSARPGFHSARVNKGHPRRQARRDRAAERNVRRTVMNAYRDLVARAMTAYPEQAQFFTGLLVNWSARLDELPAVSGPRVEFLLREIANPDLDPDALARWPDVFAEAIEAIAMATR